MNRSTHSSNDDKNLALFIDFENIALGVREAKYDKFQINLILERLLEKGKIVVKKAYADWERYSEYKRPFHEAAIELIDIPHKYYSGKNSADIRMVVDAMDLSYSKSHIDIFVIASGDSDFSPLVSKLKENNRSVIGVGVKNSSSELLVDNCDEFIYYEDLVRSVQKLPKVQHLPSKKAECFNLLLSSVQALLRENKEVIWGSMVKQTMQRKLTSFNEGYYGYNTFSDLLEDAQRNRILTLKKDIKSGTYVVTAVATAAGGEVTQIAPPAPAIQPTMAVAAPPAIAPPPTPVAPPVTASAPPSLPAAQAAASPVPSTGEPADVDAAAATGSKPVKRDGRRGRRGGRGRRRAPKGSTANGEKTASAAKGSSEGV
ncbi:MAG: NYN domain-containing protein [Planctomycetes bacterium]|nr:NYN domain-containing protein [Planctomycetota bacterium]MBI3844068.1 NYN domain-containing protein [Planctomycetota bacterium]